MVSKYCEQCPNWYTSRSRLCAMMLSCSVELPGKLAVKLNPATWIHLWNKFGFSRWHIWPKMTGKYTKKSEIIALVSAKFITDCWDNQISTRVNQERCKCWPMILKLSGVMNWLSHADRRDGYIAMEIMLDKSTRSTLVKWLSSLTWPSSLAKFLRLGYIQAGVYSV